MACSWGRRNPIAEYHQTGTDKMPARPVVDMTGGRRCVVRPHHLGPPLPWHHPVRRCPGRLDLRRRISRAMTWTPPQPDSLGALVGADDRDAVKATIDKWSAYYLGVLSGRLEAAGRIGNTKGLPTAPLPHVRHLGQRARLALDRHWQTCSLPRHRPGDRWFPGGAGDRRGHGDLASPGERAGVRHHMAERR